MNNFNSKQAEPIYYEGEKPIGIVLVHGFTSVPVVMQNSAKYFNKAGFFVIAPLLPGHGTRWQDLNSVSWKDWADAVDKAVSKLRVNCKEVYLFGLSLGGLLCLNHTLNDSDIAGCVVINPACRLTHPMMKFLPILKHFVPYTKSIASDIKQRGVVEPAYNCTPLKGLAELDILMKKTREKFASIKTPLLMFKSTEDHVIPDKCVELQNVKNCRVIKLQNSYHVAVLDNDIELILLASLQFMNL